VINVLFIPFYELLSSGAWEVFAIDFTGILAV
jgi:hypothetical protein